MCQIVKSSPKYLLELMKKFHMIAEDIQENNYICRIWKKKKSPRNRFNRRGKKCVHWKSPKVAKEIERTKWKAFYAYVLGNWI